MPEHESTLFIVDDDPMMQTMAQSVGRAAGIRTEVFTDVEEFFKSDFADQSGCILIAMNLTGLSGADAIAWLTREGVFIPSILVISNGDTSSRLRALEEGAWDVLEKPIDEATLRAGVMHALSNCVRRGHRFSSSA